MEERHENYILYGLLALVIVGMFFALAGLLKNGSAGAATVDSTQSTTQSSTQSSTQGVNQQPESGFKSIDSGSTNPGDVSIELTPLEVSDSELRVKIAVNTHSVDLSGFDLKQITTLEYGRDSVNPSSAPNLGGHHSTGELIFKINKKLEGGFTIKIKGIPKVEERVFGW